MSKKKDEEVKHECHCHEDHECHCNDDHECHCNENDHECTCGDDCHCHDHDCDDDCHCNENYSREEEYLNMARVIQADFDNYRKKSYEQIANAKIEGIILTIETFLPALDSFAEAKKMITDEKVLEGVEMIEKKIISTLANLGVEKIEAEGKPFDPNLHNAIAILNDNSLENDVVKTEYQAGYKFKDKVIRYSQVVVNKREEN